MRVNRAERRVVKDVAKVDLIKARLGVAAIPVGEDIRRDQIANPSADGPSILFFFFAGDAEEGIVEILVQIHEVVIGERADDSIAPKTSPRTELIVATAVDPAEPTAATCSSLVCDLLTTDLEGVIDVPQAIT